ncbi:hypothetical protein WJX73_004034 [Symbiochloris irregularis]|uniref:Uncharacterized protein n=1 Tax=Symbiochloris irregularis TaxID=706552 RepID=A0AAW1PBK1_9CHLO
MVDGISRQTAVSLLRRAGSVDLAASSSEQDSSDAEAGSEAASTDDEAVEVVAGAAAAADSPRRSSWGRTIREIHDAIFRGGSASSASPSPLASDDEDLDDLGELDRLLREPPAIAAADAAESEEEDTTNEDEVQFFTDSVACPTLWNKSTSMDRNIFSMAERESAANAKERPVNKLLAPQIIAAHKASYPPSVLPFAEHRNSQGKLWAAEALDVPQVLEAPPLGKAAWPMDLGCLEIPLQLDTKENVEKAVGKGMGELMWFPVVPSYNPERGGWSYNRRQRFSKPRVEFRSKEELGSKKRLLGHFGGTRPPHWSDHAEPYADLACALFILLVREVIGVEHEIILTPTAQPPQQTESAAVAQAAEASGAGQTAKRPAAQRAGPGASKRAASGSQAAPKSAAPSSPNKGPRSSRQPQGPQIASHTAVTTPGPELKAPEDAGPSTSAPRAAKRAHRRSGYPYGYPYGRKAQKPKEQKPSAEGRVIETILRAAALETDAPLAYPPASLSCVPKQFQLQGLDWMLKREETGDARGQGHLSLHPGFLQFITPGGHAIHIQRSPTFRFTFNLPTCPSDGTCGGLLCDFMGLGKTLEVLMLVLARPAGSWAIAHFPKKRPGVEKEKRGSRGTEKSESGDNKVPIKTTLIVVPASLRQQWANEIDCHLESGAITWDLLPALDAALAEDGGHSGGEDGKARRSRRNLVPAQKGEDNGEKLIPITCEKGNPLHNCDVVLATYEQLKKELTNIKSPLLQFGFWRLVLDEAQTVANSNSAAARSVNSLWRRHAWVVTGTPITSSIEELGGLLDFLACEPFNQDKEWKSIVNSPGYVGAVKQILHRIMLRRTQADVDGELALLPCTREDRWLHFPSGERACYDRVLKEANKALDAYHNGTRDGRHLVPHFTMLRQVCCHPQVVRQDDWLMGGSEHLSMTDVLGRLALRAFRDYDSVLQRSVKARMMLAAVLWNSGDKEKGLQQFESVRASQEVPGPSAGPAEEAAPAKPGAKKGKGKAAGTKRKTATEDGKLAKRPTLEQKASQERVRAWARNHLDALQLWQHALPDDTDANLLYPVLVQIEELQSMLGLAVGLDESAVHALAMGRKSKRQKGLGVDEEFSPEVMAQLEQQQAAANEKARVAELRAYDHMVAHDRDPVGRATAALRAARDEAAQEFKVVQHLYTKYQELRAASKGKQAAGAAGQPPVVEQENPTSCPICLDSSERRAITSCGHLFCSGCIHECVATRRSCPLCRTGLTTEDIFDAATDEEAAAAEDETVIGDFGTKVKALVKEVLDMRRKDPTDKCVVFSAWARVLRLVAVALKRNDVECLTLAGAASGGSSARADTVAAFQNDPNSPKVLLILMSTGGGAAGLTLTAASTVILMEPSINPALEAQAAGRVHRLGQTRPTRVIRLLVEGTIERAVLDRQRARESLEDNTLLTADTDPTSIVNLLSNHPSLDGSS